MSIKNDQIALRQKNVDFLKQKINTLFKDAFKKLFSEYSLKIKQNISDENDTNEVRQYLKREFELLNNEKCYFTNSNLSYIENIKIENREFIYCIETILNQSSGVINEIYPTLQESIKSGFSRDHSFLIRSVKNTCRKVFIKHLLESLKKDIAPETDIFKPNLSIFKNRESHLFFDFLFNDWLKDIEACRPQLSYIVWAMTKKKKEKEKETEINDYAITCSTLGEFADFWNTYPHIFKLTFKNSKLNLSNDEPSKIHEAPFDNRKEEFRKTLV